MNLLRVVGCASIASLFLVIGCGDDTDDGGSVASGGSGGIGGAGGTAGVGGTGGSSGTAGVGGTGGVADAGVDTGPPGCSSLDQGACETDPDCVYIGAGCHGVEFFASCFDIGMSPQPPPCAPLPCGDYATETECTAQQACDWWPMICPGHSYTERCRNIAYGNPDAQCS